VAGRLDEVGVEGRVRLEEALDLAAVRELLHRGDELVEAGEVLRPEARRREPYGEHLERLAHLVGLEELLLRQRADDRAAPRPDVHEPLGRQPPDRLADRPAADAELAGERRLLQLRPGRQAVGEDLLAQMRMDALPQRQVLEATSARPVVALVVEQRLGHCNPADPPIWSLVECQQSRFDPNRGGGYGQLRTGRQRGSTGTAGYVRTGRSHAHTS